MPGQDHLRPRGTFCGRTRREFLWQAGGAFTGLALSGLLDQGFLSPGLWRRWRDPVRQSFGT